MCKDVTHTNRVTILHETCRRMRKVDDLHVATCVCDAALHNLTPRLAREREKEDVRIVSRYV